MRDFIAAARAAGSALDDPLPDRDEITELYDWQAEP
jgi:hypothetical protein